MIYALVALAGSVGAACRFMFDGVMRNRVRSHLPIGTLVINIIGSLMFGILTGLVLFHGAPTIWRTAGGTGFCGGFTTFSTACLETVRLLQRRLYLSAAGQALGGLVLCVLAAAAGVALAQL